MPKFFNKEALTSPIAVGIYACLGTVGLGLGFQAWRKGQDAKKETAPVAAGEAPVMPAATNQNPVQVAAH